MPNNEEMRKLIDLVEGSTDVKIEEWMPKSVEPVDMPDGVYPGRFNGYFAVIGETQIKLDSGNRGNIQADILIKNGKAVVYNTGNYCTLKENQINEYVYDTGNSQAVTKNVDAIIKVKEPSSIGDKTVFSYSMADSDGARLFYKGVNDLGNEGDSINFTATIDRRGMMSNISDVQKTSSKKQPSANLYGVEEAESTPPGSAIKQGIEAASKTKYYPCGKTCGVQVTKTDNGTEYFATGAGFKPVKCDSYDQAKRVAQSNAQAAQTAIDRKTWTPGTYHPEINPDRSDWDDNHPRRRR